ncbi:MAG: LysE family transporter [Microcella sp.]|uniref:LysE family transporter n=1 Tax=Microcella sp. TaxID=1913979 RepID=UPI0024C98EA4|nr:LysE family transporter [Microcella sp.]UYN82976.1 MAG: LysE family transporter [Microcella sp.]
MLDALVAGVIAGYAIAIPVGAIAALLITLGAQHGARVAAGGAFGAATVDGIYATVAVTAGAVIAPLIALVEEPLRWVSVVVLIVLGIVLAWPAFRRRTAPVAAAEVQHEKTGTAKKRVTARRLFVTVGVLTLVNPVTIIYFAALIGSSTIAADAGAPERIVFVLAAFAASLSWQLLLTTAGSVVGRVLTGPTGARVTALVGGTLVIALAVRAALAP